ncbi:MAG: phospho-sugar mutase [Anaerovoracaceae bacterium]
MEREQREYTNWCMQVLSEELQCQLLEIKENEEEIYDRFCRGLTFGTSGIRGRMGVGTCRMNSVVVRRATQGIADYVSRRYAHPAIVISYDTRMHSEEYAYVAAETLAERGIDTWIMGEPQPVPLLSFAVRNMGLAGGIMITASHNPREYNGYKVYDHLGNQIDDEKARGIEACIESHGYFEKKERDGEIRGQIRTVPQGVIEDYRKNISDRAVWWKTDASECRKVLGNLSVIYTPLNGTGLAHVTEILRRLGMRDLEVVECQTEGDGQFATCPSPNPENRKAFAEAEKLAKKRIAEGRKPADLLLATDPDSDRMGVMVRDGSEYVLLSGNQAGELIFDYLCDAVGGPEGKNLEHRIVYKSLVSSPLADRIGQVRGVTVENTLTGFKNIARKMEQLRQAGREEDFLFGFEESHGYLYGTYTRDKDGVMACQLICLAAGCCMEEKLTLMEKLDQLHETYGYMETRAGALHFQREKDRQVMADIMAELFAGSLQTVWGLPVDMDRTYEKESVFQGTVKTRDASGEEGRCRQHRFVIRPSGTELKLKSYVFAEGQDQEAASEAADAILKELTAWLNMKKEEKIQYE